MAIYRQSVLRAAEDVENSFIQLGQTVIHLVQFQEQVEALEKSRNLSEQVYRAGSITLTDVLDADGHIHWRQLMADFCPSRQAENGQERTFLGYPSLR